MLPSCYSMVDDGVVQIVSGHQHDESGHQLVGIHAFGFGMGIQQDHDMRGQPYRGPDMLAGSPTTGPE